MSDLDSLYEETPPAEEHEGFRELPEGNYQFKVSRSWAEPTEGKYGNGLVVVAELVVISGDYAGEECQYRAYLNPSKESAGYFKRDMIKLHLGDVLPSQFLSDPDACTPALDLCFNGRVVASKKKFRKDGVTPFMNVYLNDEIAMDSDPEPQTPLPPMKPAPTAALPKLPTQKTRGYEPQPGESFNNAQPARREPGLYNQPEPQPEPKKRQDDGIPF